MKTAHLLKHAAIVGVFAVVLYAGCLLWRFTMTEPAVAQFHLLALKSAFPGFTGFNTASVVLGCIMSFVYGFIISVVFHALHGCCGCGMKK